MRQYLNLKRWRLPAIAVLMAVTALAVVATPSEAFAQQPGESSQYTPENVGGNALRTPNSYRKPETVDTSLRCGAALDFRQKQNGNLSRARDARTEIYSTPGDYIPRERIMRVLSNCLETAGNGPPVLTRGIRDTNLSLARWANTTANLCQVR